MLNSIGLQNPGVDAVIEKYARDVGRLAGRRSSSTSPASRSRDYVEVARRLDGVPGVAGIELNICCPNVGKGGLQFAIDAGAAGEVTAAVRRATDLPLLVKLSPNVADVRPIARAIEDAGADALTAINTLSGIAVAPSRTKPLLGNIYGGLSGRRSSRSRCGSCTRSAQVVDIPVVAIGGVTELADVLDFLAVGAVAVQVGTAIFADPTLPVRLVDELAGGVPARAASTRTATLIGTALPSSPARRRPRASSTGPDGARRRVDFADDHVQARPRSCRARRHRGPDRGALPGLGRASARATSCSRAAVTATPTSRSSRSCQIPAATSELCEFWPPASGAGTAGRWSTSSPGRRPAA